MDESINSFAVTNGQTIVAVGKVTGFVDLKSFDAYYADQYEDEKAIRIAPFYLKEDFPQVDFGIYDGRGKQFHEAHGTYQNAKYTGRTNAIQKEM